MRRSFRPSVDGLEPRALLTTIAPPVHQARHNSHTGSIIGGWCAMQEVDTDTNAIDVATSTTYTGSGVFTVAGHRGLATVTITINDDQSFAMTIDDGKGDALTATGLSLADGSAGNYRVTGATGDWSAASGTGVWYLATDSDGNANFVLNPHQ
jgi:hypothetical protein